MKRLIWEHEEDESIGKKSEGKDDDIASAADLSFNDAKTFFAGCSKRSQRRGARRSMSGGVLFLYVDAKSIECNEACGSFSTAR